MKKSLLFLGLLSLASSAQAQTAPNLGPWVEVNLVGYGTFAPGYTIQYVNTVSANVAWAVAEEDSNTGIPNSFLVTNNPAGTQFGFNATIAAPPAAQNFGTANISGINALTAVAATFNGQRGTQGGGEILRTTNGGNSWVKVSTNSQFVAGQGGFLNFVHMFDANVGVAVGDPTDLGGGVKGFEILRTTDGGLTWTRIPQANIPSPAAGEAALVHSFFARGNTIWFGGASLGANDPERIFKSVDRGLTWTASQPTALTETISKLAFKDDLNGIAYNVKPNAAGTDVVAVNLIRTSDGGATWSPITPINTASGSFFRYDIDAVDGRYYSVGIRFPVATPDPIAADFGSSYSTDGINWTNLNNSQGFFTFDLISGPNATQPVGYAGAATDSVGAGGVYKFNATLLASRNAELQRTLNVYPNPSASGVFKVALGTALKAGAQLSVVDVLGRRVLSQTLTAAAIGAKSVNLDLSHEKTGVYTLQIRTEAGVATQKLVIE